jgi:hypothetical protein
LEQLEYEENSDYETKRTSSEDSQRLEIPKEDCVIHQHQPGDEGESEILKNNDSGNGAKCKMIAQAGLVDANIVGGRHQQQFESRYTLEASSSGMLARNVLKDLVTKPVVTREIGVQEYHHPDSTTLNDAQDDSPDQARTGLMQCGENHQKDIFTNKSLTSKGSQLNENNDIERSSTVEDGLSHRIVRDDSIGINHGVGQEDSWADNIENDTRAIYFEEVENQEIAEVVDTTITGYEDGSKLSQDLHDIAALITFTSDVLMLDE